MSLIFSCSPIVYFSEDKNYITKTLFTDDREGRV